MTAKLELISFKLCPFVQRSVIALNEKNVDFKITHINLQEPPEWFGEISPLGKVPVLKVDDAVVFESAVILEYLDETRVPQLHPDDALIKARHRSWMEFASDMVMTQFQMTNAQEEQAFTEKRDALNQKLAQLDGAVAEQGPYFSGNAFHLIDTVYAPIFMRMNVAKSINDPGLVMSDRLQQWSDALLARDSVKNSVVPEFNELFQNFFAESWILNQ